jgi:multidrug transporter EmrE-like cation transporter
MVGYAFVATTIALTGLPAASRQLASQSGWSVPEVAWRQGAVPVGSHPNPWVVSVFVAATIAAVSWMAAMTRFELSRAYPFLALSFVFVLVVNEVVFGEPLTVAEVAGVVFIIAGVNHREPMRQSRCRVRGWVDT